MSDRKSTLPEDPGQPAGGGAPVSLSRRRFARGAAPVVLGTLVSTPVLGAAPYHCTVSGHVSGDASPRVGAGTTCVLGQPLSFWRDNAWPSSGGELIKGGLPNPSCSFPSNAPQGTLFGGFGSGAVAGGLANAFFFQRVTGQGGGCMITDSGEDTTPASLYQVLASTMGGELYDLGRATVVSLLNHYDDPADYPVTAARIIHMFNSTYDGVGTYDFNATVSWDRAQVVRYLTSLYPAG